MLLSHVTITTSVWQNRLDKINAEHEARHNAEQASKPENERVAFVPQTLAQYVAARVADIEASYAKQIASENEAILKDPTVAEVLADPTQAARLIKALKDPTLRQQLSDIIDGTPGG